MRALISITLASTVLLSGCAIWPKMLTFESEPEPVPEQVVIAHPPVPVEDKPAPAPVAVVAPVAMSPMPPVAEPVAAAPQIVFSPPSASPETSARAVSLVHGFYINVGLFSVAANATNAYRKLDAAGLPVFSDGVQSKKGALTRLRAGPYATRTEADMAAKKIRTLKLDAVVFRN